MPNEDAVVVADPDTPWMLSKNAYNNFKFLVTVVLPGLSTLYFTLGTIYDWPNVEQVVGTFAAVATFLGLLLKHSSTVYDKSDAKYDGAITFETVGDGGTMYTLEIPGDPADIAKMESIKFKVGPTQV